MTASKKVSKKYGYILDGLGCSECKSKMARPSSLDGIKCMNPNCSEYGVKYEFPKIEIKRV